MKNKKQQAGIGLPELLLVTIVGASIIYFSLQQYASFKRDGDVMQVRYNVDTLFQAMSKYFRANCNRNYSTSGITPHPDTEVLSGVYSQQYFPVTIADLRAKGYLTENLPISPLINYSTAAEGYVLQFNQIHPLSNRTIGLSPPASSSTADIGRIILWKAQVAVLLKDTSTTAQYQNLLQANCLSQQDSASAGFIVTPCSGALSADQPFAVFERQPSLPSTGANSASWASTQAVKQFTQMYTTDPILVLTDGTKIDTQFYVCGS